MLTEITVEVRTSAVAPEPARPQLQTLPTIGTGQRSAGFQVLPVVQAGPGPLQEGGLALLPGAELELPGTARAALTGRGGLLCLGEVTASTLLIFSTALAPNCNEETDEMVRNCLNDVWPLI